MATINYVPTEESKKFVRLFSYDSAQNLSVDIDSFYFDIPTDGYSTKYWGEFRTFEDKLCRVEIQVQGSVSPQELQFPENPVEIRYLEKGLHENILSSDAVIKVWSNSDYQYESLFSTKEQTHRVIIFVDGKPIFTGHVEPTLFEEDFTSVPYITSIPVTNGLKRLNEYTPEITTVRATMASILWGIQDCLLHTGYELPLLVNNSLFDYYHHKPVTTPYSNIEQSFVYTAVLKKFETEEYEFDNAFDLLNDFLKPFQARLYYFNGAWVIDRVKNKLHSGTVKFVKYDFANQKKAYVTLTGLNKELDNGADNKFLSGASLSKEAGFGSQIVQADSPIGFNLVNNEPEVPIQSIDNGYDNHGLWWYHAGAVPSVWFNSNRGGLSPEYFTNEKGISQGYKWTHTSVTNHYAYLTQHGQCDIRKGDKVNIKYRIAGGTGTNKVTNWLDIIQSRMVLNIGGRHVKFSPKTDLEYERDKYDALKNVPYLNKTHNVLDYAEKATTTAGDCLICHEWQQLADGADDIYVELKELSTGTEVSFSFEWEYNSTAWYYAISIFPLIHMTSSETWAMSNTYIPTTWIGDVEVKVDKAVSDDNAFIVGDSTTNREAPKIDLRFWDRENDISVNWTYPNSILRLNGSYNFPMQDTVDASNYEEVSKWSDIDRASDSFNQECYLAERLVQDNFDQYAEPRDIISGTIHFQKQLSHALTYTVNHRPGRKYIIKGFTYNVANDDYRITVEQIKDRIIETPV